MAYADHNFYTERYYGDVLTPEAADRYLDRASDLLDTLTFGRLAFAFPTFEPFALKVRKAVCAVAEAMYRIDEERKAAASTQAEDGSYRGAVKSISSGRESISFASGESGSAYAAAAKSEEARDALLRDIAVQYLANISDANGVNLLYAGRGG